MLANKCDYEKKHRDFVNVMSSVMKYNQLTPDLMCSNLPHCYRSSYNSKRPLHTENVWLHRMKRFRANQTSTPLALREQPQVLESDTSTSNTSESLLSDVSQFEPVKRSPTNLSNDLDRNKITPDKPESKSLELKRVAETTQRWEVAAAGRGLIRFRSLPDGLDKLTENPFFSGYPRARSYSVSDMGLSTCSWSIDRKTVNKLSYTEQEVMKDVDHDSKEVAVELNGGEDASVDPGDMNFCLGDSVRSSVNYDPREVEVGSSYVGREDLFTGNVNESGALAYRSNVNHDSRKVEAESSQVGCEKLFTGNVNHDSRKVEVESSQVGCEDLFTGNASGCSNVLLSRCNCTTAYKS